MDATGPLTCLWSDLLNKEAKVSSEDILLLIQCALVLLGSASHTVSQERRKIAWSRINPQLKTLATEEYDKRESNLFGPGFLRRIWSLSPRSLSPIVHLVANLHSLFNFIYRRSNSLFFAATQCPSLFIRTVFRDSSLYCFSFCGYNTMFGSIILMISFVLL